MPLPRGVEDGHGVGKSRAPFHEGDGLLGGCRTLPPSAAHRPERSGRNFHIGFDHAIFQSRRNRGPRCSCPRLGARGSAAGQKVSAPDDRRRRPFAMICDTSAGSGPMSCHPYPAFRGRWLKCRFPIRRVRHHGVEPPNPGMTCKAVTEDQALGWTYWFRFHDAHFAKALQERMTARS